MNPSAITNEKGQNKRRFQSKQSASHEKQDKRDSTEEKLSGANHICLVTRPMCTGHTVFADRAYVDLLILMSLDCYVGSGGAKVHKIIGILKFNHLVSNATPACVYSCKSSRN